MPSNKNKRLSDAELSTQIEKSVYILVVKITKNVGEDSLAFDLGRHTDERTYTWQEYEFTVIKQFKPCLELSDFEQSSSTTWTNTKLSSEASLNIGARYILYYEVVPAVSKFVLERIAKLGNPASLRELNLIKAKC